LLLAGTVLVSYALLLLGFEMFYFFWLEVLESKENSSELERFFATVRGAFKSKA
jgi:hypothetical protein